MPLLAACMAFHFAAEAILQAVTSATTTEAILRNCRRVRQHRSASVVRNDGQVLLEKMATGRTVKSNALYFGYQGVMAIGFD